MAYDNTMKIEFYKPKYNLDIKFDGDDSFDLLFKNVNGELFFSASVEDYDSYISFEDEECKFTNGELVAKVNISDLMETIANGQLRNTNGTTYGEWIPRIVGDYKTEHDLVFDGKTYADRGYWELFFKEMSKDEIKDFIEFCRDYIDIPNLEFTSRDFSFDKSDVKINSHGYSITINDDLTIEMAEEFTCKSNDIVGVWESNHDYGDEFEEKKSLKEEAMTTKLFRFIQDLYDVHYITEEQLNKFRKHDFSKKEIKVLEQNYEIYKTSNEFDEINNAIKSTVNMINSFKESMKEGISAFNKVIAKKYNETEPNGAGQYYLDWRFDLHDEKDNIEAIADKCGVTVEFQTDEGYFEVFEESKKSARKSIKESSVRCVTFEQIVDSRSDDISKGEKILNDRKDEIIELCGDDFSVYTNKIRFYDWDDGTNQYRQKYYVRKNNNKVTWNDLYKIVNSVKAVPYDFEKVNDTLFESRKSIKESIEFYNDFGTGVYCATSSNGWTFCYCPLSWINKKGVEDLVGWSVMDDKAHYIDGDSWENKTDEEINDSIDNFEKLIKKYAKEDAKEIIKDFRSTLDKD